MSKRLNFGPRGGGVTFEEYVLNALNHIERWSHDVITRFDATTVTVTTSLLNEDGDYLMKESETGLGLES